MLNVTLRNDDTIFLRLPPDIPRNGKISLGDSIAPGERLIK